MIVPVLDKTAQTPPLYAWSRNVIRRLSSSSIFSQTFVANQV